MSTSTTLTLCPSSPFLKTRSPNRTPFSRFNAIRCSSPKVLDLASSNGAAGLRSTSLCSSSWTSAHPLLQSRQTKTTRAASSSSAGDASEEEEEEKASAFKKTLQLGSFFGLWYLFNIYFNIYNKQVLKVFPFPVTITTAQFAVGTVIVFLMWTLNLHKKPQISTSQLVAILPLAIVHTMGNLFTNMSLGKVAVSFTHTIKAMEPFFSVLLSAMFLGEMPTFWVVSSLLPIVGGVALASITEASFNWAGFWSAMASNVTFQSRNVLSKKFMVKKDQAMDNINLFSLITIMSLFLLFPVALFMEGVKFTPSYLQSAGLNVKDLGTKALVAGICFHAYQQILKRTFPSFYIMGL